MEENKRKLRVDESVKLAIPVYEQSFSFIRDELDGNKSVRLKTLPRVQELFLNQTSFEILELCDGKRNCEEILSCMLNKYLNVSKDILYKDFFNIIMLMSKFQIISWRERNPFMNKTEIKIEELKFELLDDTNIREIIKFVNERKEDLQWINLMHDYRNYSELYIREMLFNYAEDFFALRNTSNDIIGLISIKYSVNSKSSVGHIGIIVCDRIYLDTLVRGIVQFSGSKCINPLISKIKVQILKDDFDEMAELISVLKNSGFVLENTSIKEFKGKDLMNYCYYYN